MLCFHLFDPNSVSLTCLRLRIQQVDEIREKYTDMEVKYRMSNFYASKDVMSISTDVAAASQGSGGGGRANDYKYSSKVVEI